LAVPTRDDGLDWATHEHGAVLAVIRQAMAATGAPELVTLAADVMLALDPLLEFGFLWSALVAPARAVLTRATDVGDALAEGRVGYMLGGALMQLGRLDEAQDITARAERAARQADDIAVRAEICTVSGVIMFMRKDFPLAVHRFTEAVELAASCGSRWGRANALLNLASALLNAGRVPDALAACQESVDLFQPLGDPFGEAYGLCVQGRVMRRLGDPDAAISAFTRSITVAASRRLPNMEVISMVEIADCHLAAGRFSEAVTWAERGRASASRVRWERTEAESLALLGQALAALDEPERSQACLHQAHHIYSRLGLPGADELRPLLKTTQ
jgi:tetratricopeptide (TPR) repeat protein